MYVGNAAEQQGSTEPQLNEENDGAEPNQFMSLLESLEARVDLMAQMQHTRAAIQKRARAIEDMRVRQQGAARANNAIEDVVQITSERFEDRMQAFQPSANEQILPYDHKQ